jgi:hypothetical protein
MFHVELRSPEFSMKIRKSRPPASFRPRQPHLARFSSAIDSMSGDQMLSCNAENKESSDQALDTRRSPVDGRRA